MPGRLTIANPCEQEDQLETAMAKSLAELKRMGWPSAHTIFETLTNLIQGGQHTELVISGLLGGALLSDAASESDNVKTANKHITLLFTSENLQKETIMRIERYFLTDRFHKFTMNAKLNLINLIFELQGIGYKFQNDSFYLK